MTMVMRKITASKFKAQCLALLDEVAAGEEIVVTKHGKPVAHVVPPAEPEDLVGSVTFLVDDDEFVHAPAFDGLWNAER